MSPATVSAKRTFLFKKSSCIKAPVKLLLRNYSIILKFDGNFYFYMFYSCRHNNKKEKKMQITGINSFAFTKNPVKRSQKPKNNPTDYDKERREYEKTTDDSRSVSDPYGDAKRKFENLHPSAMVKGKGDYVVEKRYSKYFDKPGDYVVEKGYTVPLSESPILFTFDANADYYRNIKELNSQLGESHYWDYKGTLEIPSEEKNADSDLESKEAKSEEEVVDRKDADKDYLHLDTKKKYQQQIEEYRQREADAKQRAIKSKLLNYEPLTEQM